MCIQKHSLLTWFSLFCFVLFLIRYLKQVLQHCENLRTFTSSDRNKWTESVELLIGLIPKCQHFFVQWYQEPDVVTSPPKTWNFWTDINTSGLRVWSCWCVRCGAAGAYRWRQYTGFTGMLNGWKAHRVVQKFPEGKNLFSSTWRTHVKSSTPQSTISNRNQICGNISVYVSRSTWTSLICLCCSFCLEFSALWN